MFYNQTDSRTTVKDVDLCVMQEWAICYLYKMSTSNEIKQEMPSDEGNDGRSVKQIGRELCVKIGNGFGLVGSYTIR